MPAQKIVTIPPNTFVDLTGEDVINVTFQNQHNDDLWLVGTASATTPSNKDGSLKYLNGFGELGRSLASMFPGITGVVRIWGYTESNDDDGKVMVAHV